jgi:hypothetical protein
MAFFENTSDFLAANLDGTSADYGTLKKINGDALNLTSSVKSTLEHEAIRVLSRSELLYAFFARQAFTLETGDKMKVDHVAGTMLFARISNSWKVRYYHQSELPPVKM